LADIPNALLGIAILLFIYQAYLFLTRKQRFFSLKATRHLQYWQPGLPSFTKSNSEEEVANILFERYWYHFKVNNKNVWDADENEIEKYKNYLKNSEDFKSYLNNFREKEPWIFYFFSHRDFKRNYKLLRVSVNEKRKELENERMQQKKKNKTYY
jgi:hypothetical protein